MAKRLRSKFRHAFGLNQGSVMSWLTPEGRVWIGFMCECGTIHGLHDATSVVDKHLKREAKHG